MQITPDRVLRGSLLTVVYLLGILGIAASGGGGGDDDGPTSISYSGNTDPAVISRANAARLVGNVLVGQTLVGSSSGVSAKGGTSIDTATHGIGLAQFPGRQTQKLRNAMQSSSSLLSRSTWVRARTDVDETEPCDNNGGSIHITGFIEDNGTGTLTLEYINCQEDGEILDGTVTAQINAFDLGLFIPTDVIYNFAILTITSSTINVSISGSIHSQISIGTQTEQLTLDKLVARNNDTGEMLMIQNQMSVIDYDNIFSPSSFSETITGRIYDSTHGYVDFSTIVAITFSTITQEYPDGGQLLLTGSLNSGIQVTVISDTYTLLDFDLDGDTTFESSATVNWTELETGSDLADSDGDGMHDNWEILFGLNPEVDDSNGDLDGDGFSNYYEYLNGTDPSQVTFNAQPVARFSFTASPIVLFEVSLDASGSSDADGDALSYFWALTDKPTGSNTILSDTTQVVAAFIPDQPGDYSISLIVNDGLQDSNPLVQTINVSNTKPVAIAPALKQGMIGQVTLLDGSNSSDADGHSLNYQWQLLEKPIGSGAVVVNQSSEIASFNADIFGNYTFQLVVDDGFDTSDPATLTVSVAHHFTGLNFRVTDVEYSDALELAVMISADASSLYTYKPIDHSMTSLALPLAPTSVSVSPDGLFVAVGHNGWISYVDLTANSVVKTFPVTTDVFDIVLDGNGYVHAFPRIDQWERIRSVHITSEVETLHTGNSIRAGTLARLHPGGTAIYGADNGLSPSDIEKYDISSSPVAYLYDSPYHGDFAMCGNLWFSEDGLRIFTRCGNVFRSSPIRAQDMIYNGSLENLSGTIVDLDHSSEAKKVAAIYQGMIGNMNLDTEIWFYDDAFLAEAASLLIPYFTIGNNEFPAHGKFLSYNSDGTQYFVIVQADANSGILNDFAVITSASSGDPTGINKAPIADAGINQAVMLTDSVMLDGGLSSDANGDDLTYDWQILDAPPGSTAALSGATSSVAQLVPDLVGAYTIGLTVHDGFLFSNQDIVTVTAVNAGGTFLLQLDYSILDAEYSDTLERIVSVSATEMQLYTFDTASYRQTRLSLPLPPTSVSVSPDGLFAGVGHNGWISYVDLTANSVIKTFPVSTDILDIVLDGNGYVHAFPQIDQWERIRSVHITSEVETLHNGNFIYAGTQARLHPGGTAIYGADNGLSPSDIEKYDVSTNPVTYLYDSPYHGDFAMCGNLWFSEDGLRIFTRCGNTFKSSVDPVQDMTYNGALESMNDLIVSLNHSVEAGKVAVIIESGFISNDPLLDTKIRFYNDDFLTFSDTASLPDFSVGNNNYAAHGRFVFFNSVGTRFFAVVQADSSSGLLNDTGIFVH